MRKALPQIGLSAKPEFKGHIVPKDTLVYLMEPCINVLKEESIGHELQIDTGTLYNT